MAPLKALPLFILTFFTLAGCDIEENSGDAEVNIIETEKLLDEEQVVIEVSVIPNEFGSDLNIELPNNFRTAMSDKGEFESVIVTRDMNNAVDKRSLVFLDEDAELIVPISIDTSSLNSIALHFYELDSSGGRLESIA